MGPERYDLVILGAGSTAFAAALKAAELGKRAAMIEARTVGGTCVNRGCLPSKHLIEAAKLLHDARHPRYPGISPCAPNLDFATLIAQKDDLICAYREQKYARVAASAQVEIVQGRAVLRDPHTVVVGERALEGDQILLALGAHPVIPPIAGLGMVPYLTSDLLTSQEADELRELPRSLIIIGGGAISLELGQMFARFGTQVTLLARGPWLLAQGYEPEMGQAIQTVLTAEGIAVRVNASVRRVKRDGDAVLVTIETGAGQEELRAAKLLIAAGRRPNTDAIGLEQAGVATDEGGAIKVDAYLRTTAPHIWAGGDVIGPETASQMATPVGARDGAIAAHNALAGGDLRPVDRRVIPRAIFTDPPLASVGLTEQAARSRGHRCWCTTLPMELVPRAGAIRDTRGIIKMVADAETNEVLGVAMIGAAAAEVIHEAAMGLHFHATLDDFIDLLHVYPTMAEALKIAAISRFTDPTLLSCCAE